MSYYFPSPIQDLKFKKIVADELIYTFDSGKSALRVAIKNLKLSIGSKVAIPAFVCAEVKSSIELEFYKPVLFDLKSDKTFWTEYDFDRILKEEIKAVVLVHLYGFIHPDTNKITKFCKENNIYLIHDAAQSFGINEEKLLESNAIIYSFGAGKSTAAAGGGWIKNMQPQNYFKSVLKSPLLNFREQKAIHFLKTRLYDYKITKQDLILNRIIKTISKPYSGIFEMTQFQKHAASYVLRYLNDIKPQRKQRWTMLKQAINDHKDINLSYDDENGIYFKAVFFIKKDPLRFKSYLKQKNIPFFSLFDKEGINMNSDLPHFKERATHFIEISTEASIPESEMKRVANIIASYKNEEIG